MFEFNQAPGYGYPQQQQFNGISPQAMPKRNNYLTEEEIKRLQSNRAQFTLAITEEEHLKAKCNHRTADGMYDALEYDSSDPSGQTVVCKICGQKFVPIATDSPEDYVQSITDEFINMLQTIKIMYVDLPAEAANIFFDIIPLASKAPELFKLAVNNMAKYENNNFYGYQGGSQGAASVLNSFLGMLGNGGFVQQAQPVYGQPAPGMNPGFAGQPNAFGYPGASQVGYGYQPGTTGFAYNPTQAAPQAAPTPAADTTTTTTNVQA